MSSFTRRCLDAINTQLTHLSTILSPSRHLKRQSHHISTLFYRPFLTHFRVHPALSRCNQHTTNVSQCHSAALLSSQMTKSPYIDAVLSAPTHPFTFTQPRSGRIRLNYHVPFQCPLITPDDKVTIYRRRFIGLFSPIRSRSLGVVRTESDSTATELRHRSAVPLPSRCPGRQSHHISTPFHQHHTSILHTKPTADNPPKLLRLALKPLANDLSTQHVFADAVSFHLLFDTPFQWNESAKASSAHRYTKSVYIDSVLLVLQRPSLQYTLSCSAALVLNPFPAPLNVRIHEDDMYRLRFTGVAASPSHHDYALSSTPPSACKESNIDSSAPFRSPHGLATISDRMNTQNVQS